MEKIKNILSGNKNDDVTTSDHNSGLTSGTTGGQTSGTTTGHQTGLTGEGSHLAGNRDTVGSGNTSGLTGQNTTGSGIGNTGTSSGTTAGPHSSNLANKADPRVDSDLDGSRTAGNTGGVGNTNTGTGYGTSSGTTAGPHSSDLANKADPRVDSDLDGSRTAGNTVGVGNTTSSGTTAGPHSSNLANKADPRVDSDMDGSRTVGNTGNTTSTGTGYGSSTGNTGYSGPHQSEAANRLDPSVNTSGATGLESAHHHSKTHGGGAEEADTHHGSHVGRDAAVGAGGVGLAEHEHHKHQNERGTGVGGTTGSTGLGQSTGAYDNTTGSTGHSTGAYDNTTGSSTTGTGHQSHVGRDAGLGAAGVGAAGVAEHEHHKHQAGAASDLPGPAPNTAGPHKQDWLNKLDPRVNANPDKPQSTGHGPLKVEEGHTGTAKPYDPSTGYVSNPHHHGVSDVNPDGSTSRHANPTHHGQSRTNDLPGHDAAAVGALGGAGAYEAGKHHHGTDSGVEGTPMNTTTGPHSSKLKHEADPTMDNDRSRAHNYGTNAGIAGGVGAGAYEAEKHHQKHDKDLTESERAAKKEHKHELKEEKREHKESKGGLLSFLHRDKNKKYTPEEEAEFDRQEREHNSHKGRDALGGAAVGGAAYEAEKHHHDQHTDTNKPLPTAPGNHGIGTGAGTQNALAGDNTTSTSSGHHLGRDAAAVGGAGALSEHEHRKHEGVTGSQHDTTSSTHTGTHGATPLVEKPRGTDLGDKLHGVERNRGVQGGTGFVDSLTHGTGSSTTGTGVSSTTGTGVGSTTGTGTGQHHYGRDATAVGGAAALGEHEHRKHEHENVGSSGIGNQSSGITGSSTGTGNQHHLGRDAGVAAGGAGLAEHEHRKHEHENVGSSGIGNQSSGITGSSTGTGNQHHLGRDAGVAAGGAGLAEHEHRKHEGVTGSQYDNTSSGLGSSNQGSGLGGNEYRKDDITGGQGYGTTGQQSGLTGTGNQSSGLTGTGSGFDSNTTGSGDRNRLHKDPPAGHAAAGGVPASGTERERLVGQGEERLGEDTGVAHSHAEGGVNAASNY